MPYVNLKIIKNQVSEEQKEQIVEGLTNLIVEIMGRNRDLTVITIDELNENNWIIGGKKLSSDELKTRIVTFVNIKVSKCTTNPNEINQMIKATKAMIKSIMGSYDVTNYFIVDELNSESWGFDELSMKERNRLENQ